MEWTNEWNERGNGMDEGMQWIITIPCLVWLPCVNGMSYYCVLFGRQEKRSNKISGEWWWWWSVVVIVGGYKWRWWVSAAAMGGGGGGEWLLWRRVAVRR
ncbi:hypothetical protein HanIR_Chr08g0380001 [Helianthus annuus]|nr:hypothetical protein HanIR_Chr08g0380001 [Helianthus annuus]